jgi:hypothetical protein
MPLKTKPSDFKNKHVLSAALCAKVIINYWKRKVKTDLGYKYGGINEAERPCLVFFITETFVNR